MTNGLPSKFDTQSRTDCPQITQIDADSIARIHRDLKPNASNREPWRGR